MRILLIEDEPSLARAVDEHLVAERSVCDWYATVDEALCAVRTLEYDLVLLDLHLPDGDGMTILKHLRSLQRYTPVIILSARDKVSDRIKGLEFGADDYIIKPFDLQELSARIATVTRRQLKNASNIVTVGPVIFDLQRRTTTRDDTLIFLTPSEWAVMECLLRRSSVVVPKAQLEETLYALGKEVESNAIEAHISRLRSKLGRDVIVTHRGLGYSVAR
ncbi:MAG: response regulator transcription factor [Albidovulum sp.]